MGFGRVDLRSRVRGKGWGTIGLGLGFKVGCGVSCPTYWDARVRVQGSRRGSGDRSIGVGIWGLGTGTHMQPGVCTRHKLPHLPLVYPTNWYKVQ